MVDKAPKLQDLWTSHRAFFVNGVARSVVCHSESHLKNGCLSCLLINCCGGQNGSLGLRAIQYPLCLEKRFTRGYWGKRLRATSHLARRLVRVLFDYPRETAKSQKSSVRDNIRLGGYDFFYRILDK